MSQADTSPDSTLHRLRVKAALVLFFETLWPLLLPLLLLAMILASLLWLGLFQILPRWLHISLAGLFVAAALLLAARLRHAKWPDQHAVNRRLEQENQLPHSPLQLSDDQPTMPDDPLAQALWLEHRKRMAAQLQQLHGFLPHPNIPARDPLALRSLAILLFVPAAAFSYSPLAGAIRDLWHPPAAIIGPQPRIDAWVTPPAYTGKAPVFLSADVAQPMQPVQIPQGSILKVQINGSTNNRLTLTTTDSAHTGASTVIAPQSTADDHTNPLSTGFEQVLNQSVQAELRAGATDISWQLDIIADQPPIISFTKDPTYALNGTLELHYQVVDDYGLTRLQGDITLLEQPDQADGALVQAPQLQLSLPKTSAGNPAETTSRQDLTMHPWAGKYVGLQLTATDEAGQSATSKSVQFVLPQRPFINPLARAVVEQRQRLALDKTQKTAVIQMLDALTMHPATTIGDVTHFLAIRSIRERLKLARHDEDLRQLVDYMWNVARGIEDGQLSDAEKALRAAQEALSQALQNNAGPEEIARLTAELREAMNRYLNEMARRQQNNPNKNAQINPNSKVLSQRDIDRIMQQIEDLARSGNHAQAQQMLSQLQELMNNLQPGQNAQSGRQGQNGQSAEGNAAQQQLNQLGDLMRRQQQLMNETFQLDQKLQDQTDNFSYDGDGEQQSDPEQERSRQNTEQQLKQLQQQQQALQNELNTLTEQLKQHGLESAKELDQAQSSMGRAGRALGQGEGAMATDRQAEALDALRRGAREMMQQLQQAQGEGEGQQQGQGQNQGQQGSDPLGRESGSGSQAGSKGDQLPNQIDIQKARRILDEIRKKLNDALSPQQEKDYLERLLKKD